MSNRHSFKLQFEGRIRSNCRGLNNIKIDQNYNEAKNSNGESVTYSRHWVFRPCR